MDWSVVHVLHAARTVHRCQAYKCIRHISLLARLHLLSSIATAQMWCARPWHCATIILLFVLEFLNGFSLL